MFKIRLGHRPVGAIVVAMLLTVALATPALADTEVGHTGTTGFHALRDTQRKPGATCRYKGIEPSPGGYSYEGKLKWIDVRPPKVRAVSGSQQVGWRFVVERQASNSSTWQVTYTSPIQRDRTNSTTNASFSTMGINVNVPADGNDDVPSYLYRVKVKMFWYTPSGSVQGTATHLVDWYKNVLNGWPFGRDPKVDKDDYPCQGWQGWEIA